MTENKDVLLIEHGEPTTYQEAIVDPNSEKWVEAMKVEMQSMYDNQVWNLVTPVGNSRAPKAAETCKNCEIKKT